MFNSKGLKGRFSEDLPEIDRDLELYITKVKLASAEKTLHRFMWVAGAIFVVLVAGFGWYNVYNIYTIKQNLDNYSVFLAEQFSANKQQNRESMENSIRRVDNETGVMRERLSFSMEQVDLALKRADLLPGEPVIMVYVGQHELSGDTLDVARGRSLPKVRIFNDGEGSTTSISISLYYSGFNLGTYPSGGQFNESDEDGYNWAYAMEDRPVLDAKKSMWIQFPYIDMVEFGVYPCKLKVYYGSAAPAEVDFWVNTGR